MNRGVCAVLLAGLLASVGTAQTGPGPEPSPSATPAAEATPTPAPASAGETPSAAPPEAAVTPTPAPAPEPGPPAASGPLRIVETPAVPVATLPSGNPFSSPVEAPAAAPPTPRGPKGVQPATFFVAIRVDSNGKAGASRRVRDPIPSLAAESQKSFARWTFEPGRRTGQPVASWASLRLELQVEMDAPRIEHFTLTPIAASSPLPAPLAWGPDAAWLDAYSAPPPADGALPVEQLEAPPVPKKTPWSADSWKGPFAVRFWVRVSASGHVERAIPLEASDPVLIAYFRRAMDAWAFRPARAAGGAATASWNELQISGQISYSVEIRQISTLRRSL